MQNSPMNQNPRDVLTNALLHLDMPGRKLEFAVDQQIAALTASGLSIVPAVSDEGVARYVAKCREMSADGEYSWWSGLASTLEYQASEIGRLRELLVDKPNTVTIAYEDGDHMRLSRAIGRLERQKDAAEADRAALQARVEELEKGLAEARKPDFFWPHDDPEGTYDTAEEVMRELAGYDDEVLRVSTGKSLDDLWLANRVVSLHEGEPDEVEVAAFDNPSDAMACFKSSLASLLSTAGGKDGD